MSVVAVLLVCSMIVAGGFLIAFLWAVRSGQYDDKHTPSMRMLFEDPPVDARKSAPASKPEESSQHTSQ
jgi:cbb3-type cytochrome oxidase maturation protein